MRLGQGHRVYHGPGLALELSQLISWTCRLDGPCVRGEPTDEPQRRISHRGGRCGVVVCTQKDRCSPRKKRAGCRSEEAQLRQKN